MLMEYTIECGEKLKKWLDENTVIGTYYSATFRQFRMNIGLKLLLLKDNVFIGVEKKKSNTQFYLKVGDNDFEIMSKVVYMEKYGIRAILHFFNHYTRMRGHEDILKNFILFANVYFKGELKIVSQPSFKIKEAQ